MTLPMSLVHFCIVQQWRWRFLPLRNMTQELSIAHEQRVDGLDHLSSDTTNDSGFSGIGLGAFIKRTASFDQTLIQPCPFVVSQTDDLHDSQKHDLLHGSGSSAGQVGGIQGASRLSHHRRFIVFHPCDKRLQFLDLTRPNTAEPIIEPFSGAGAQHLSELLHEVVSQFDIWMQVAKRVEVLLLLRIQLLLPTQDEKGCLPRGERRRWSKVAAFDRVLSPFREQAHELLVHGPIRLGVAKGHQFPIQLCVL